MRKLFCLSAFALIVAAGSSANAQSIGVENVTRGAASANVSNVQRALNSRAGLLERANARARGQGQAQVRTDVSTRAGLETRANANVRVNASTNASLRGNGGSAPALLPPVAGVGTARGLIRQRLDLDRQDMVRGRVRTGVDAVGRLDLENRGRQTEPRRPDQARPGAPSRRPEILQMRAEVLAEARTRANISNAERLLVMRLAQIDKMRDNALASGNERQLEQADHLEQLARWQFENRGSARANNPFAAAVQTETESSVDAAASRRPVRRGRIPAPIAEGQIRSETEAGAEFGNAIDANTQSEAQGSFSVEP